MPLSMHVTSTPSKRSMRFPVGSSEPQTEPAVSRKLMLIGAAVPGTPSMRASPAYSTRPPGVWTSMSLRVPVLRVNTRKVVTSPVGLTRPVSKAEGRHRGQHVAAVRRGIDPRFLDRDLREQKLEVHPALAPARTMPTLLVSGIGAAQAVDLAHIGRTHHREQHGVARRDLPPADRSPGRTVLATCHRA